MSASPRLHEGQRLLLWGPLLCSRRQHRLVLVRAILSQKPTVEVRRRLALVLTYICTGTIAGLKSMGIRALHSFLVARSFRSGKVEVGARCSVLWKKIVANRGANPAEPQRRRTFEVNYSRPRHALTVRKPLLSWLLGQERHTVLRARWRSRPHVLPRLKATLSLVSAVLDRQQRHPPMERGSPLNRGSLQCNSRTLVNDLVTQGKESPATAAHAADE